MRTSAHTRPVIGAVALAVASGALLLPTTTASAADTATVSILHAVPGATVDVYANGKALLTDFEPGTLTDPQKLPAGSYDLKVVAAGDGADGDAVAELENAEVPAGANVTVVAAPRRRRRPGADRVRERRLEHRRRRGPADRAPRRRGPGRGRPRRRRRRLRRPGEPGRRPRPSCPPARSAPT